MSAEHSERHPPIYLVKADVSVEKLRYLFSIPEMRMEVLNTLFQIHHPHLIEIYEELIFILFKLENSEEDFCPEYRRLIYQELGRYTDYTYEAVTVLLYAIAREDSSNKVIDALVSSLIQMGRPAIPLLKKRLITIFKTRTDDPSKGPGNSQIYGICKALKALGVTSEEMDPLALCPPEEEIEAEKSAAMRWLDSLFLVIKK